ncbi:sensor histidine kinase [Amphibacillus cookii]|uniref:sensor histidine kinase n=1 Tax=Amphibacillus cookii TaxID=767787 RepID=UPI00195B8A04|nr:HAMP domain-containing sensor histidine kinase [Amphibacillus cookii]MBM7541614.1 signal transduction histidine kinase [Amphibacillus cookii]
MSRSLYWKFVFTFITGVIGSLLASYLITALFFQDEYIYQQEIEQTSDYIAELLTLVDTQDLPRLLQLLDDAGVETVILDYAGQPFLPEMNIDFINEEMIEQVKAIDDSEVATFIPDRRQMKRFIGTTIYYQDQSYLLFVNVDFTDNIAGSRRLTLHALLLTLLIGSSFIIWVSRYFVGSIRSVTTAAEQLATGDFTVRLSTDRQDEVGRLMRSFNDLAQALANMDEVRETFVSNVSHEIQSPLTSIKGYTRALQDGLIDQENQTEYLRIIYQEADRLSRLSDNLLRMASLDSEKHPYQPERYRLAEQIRRVVLSTELLWQEKNITIHLDLMDRDIVADQDLMEQVWLNLLVNAIKYNHQGGDIHISNYIEEHNHVIRVNDTGVGIPEESLPYLFDRFYKVDQARSNNHSGNGLGLSIVKKIILLHGGSINVVSEIGVGTTFFIRLPSE